MRERISYISIPSSKGDMTKEYLSNGAIHPDAFDGFVGEKSLDDVEDFSRLRKDEDPTAFLDQLIDQAHQEPHFPCKGQWTKLSTRTPKAGKRNISS